MHRLHRPLFHARTLAANYFTYHRKFTTTIPKWNPATASPPPVKTPLPLEGITVLSLEQAIAAPICTRHLADAGARIIKVERPQTGDFARLYDARVQGQASHFIWANRSKESLALDLKNPRDLAILHKLVGKVDVLVQNLAPGAAARLGLGWEEVHKKNGRLVMCDISGYGSDGPYRDKKAYDLLVQSEAGVLSVTGTPEQPCKVALSIADIAAGMYAYTNILTALLSRAQTGRGRRIDISMLESMVEWMSFPLYYTLDGQPPPPRVGAAHATIFPYGPFTAGKDGKSVMLGLQNEREWEKLCSVVLEQPGLAKDPRFCANTLRVENREALRAIMEGVFADLTAEGLVERLERAGIANASLNEMKDVWAHPQLKARGRWTEIDTPSGRVPALLPPGVEGKDGARMDKVPAVGEHNESILKEFGIEV